MIVIIIFLQVVNSPLDQLMQISEFETRYIDKILKETAIIYARLINQYKYKHQILFSVSFHRINEENKRSDEIRFF